MIYPFRLIGASLVAYFVILGLCFFVDLYNPAVLGIVTFLSVTAGYLTFKRLGKSDLSLRS